MNARNAKQFDDSSNATGDSSSNRLREDALAKAEEKARERYAAFRNQAEEQARIKVEEEQEMKKRLESTTK